MRSDLFSLGAVLVNVAVGSGMRRDPHVLKAVRPELPPSFADLIANVLAPSPDDRPPDAETVLESLNQVRSDLLGVGPGRRPSGEFPHPDLGELKWSYGVRATDYAVGDVIEGRFVVLQELGEGNFSKAYRVLPLDVAI